MRGHCEETRPEFQLIKTKAWRNQIKKGTVRPRETGWLAERICHLVKKQARGAHSEKSQGRPFIPRPPHRLIFKSFLCGINKGWKSCFILFKLSNSPWNGFLRTKWNHPLPLISPLPEPFWRWPYRIVLLTQRNKNVDFLPNQCSPVATYRQVYRRPIISSIIRG